MKDSTVSIPHLVDGQSRGAAAFLVLINRGALVIWIALLVFIFAVIEGFSLDTRDVNTVYTVFGGIAGLHVLLMAVLALGIGGPPQQPGELRCADEGLWIRFRSGRGSWRRASTIPWDRIRGATAGSFKDTTVVRGRTTGSAVGSGAPVRVRTYHAGLILHLDDGAVRRLVWLHTPGLGSVSRADLRDGVRDLRDLAEEINTRVRSRPDALVEEADQDERLSSAGIARLDRISGHSPKAATSRGSGRIGIPDVALLILFVVSAVALTEISRPDESFAFLGGSPEIPIREDAVPLDVRYAGASQVVDHTSVTIHVENPTGEAVRIHRVIAHSRWSRRDITDAVAVLTEPSRRGAAIEIGSDEITFTSLTADVRPQINLRRRNPIEIYGVPTSAAPAAAETPSSPDE